VRRAIFVVEREIKRGKLQDLLCVCPEEWYDIGLVAVLSSLIEATARDGGANIMEASGVCISG
jgi:hypothetical protein